jgi:hypothetical protein
MLFVYETPGVQFLTFKLPYTLEFLALVLSSNTFTVTAG